MSMHLLPSAIRYFEDVKVILHVQSPNGQP